MIINSAPKNEAIVSNVTEIAEFRIQQSAEAFGILSSGLYANKIRAVIRELSCNAVDSHVSANKKDTPFDVHLPNAIEPWFSVRDYGVGLSYDQVTKIYTTYFMSTKGESNDQIGGLGLGSKSPFSYTDNFTVTSSKDGVKGIYTAFINEHGVPSIALMEQSATTDPNGVEVKFSVNERNDFAKFVQEAQSVYSTFELRPVISGVASFEIRNIAYRERDIVPGVHYLASNSGSRSVAVMGNVAYPIDVPNAATNLGELARLLQCGLELNFAIGEIKFQASREGLSYVPETIAAIKARLTQVNAVLAVKVAAEADVISCLYARQTYLRSKHDTDLFKAATIKYCTDTKFPLVDLTTTSHYFRESQIQFNVETLEKQYNIKINAFSKSNYYYTATAITATLDRAASAATGIHSYFWNITADTNLNIVVNDTTVGAAERAKFHWKTLAKTLKQKDQHVYVLSKANKSKPMLTSKFLKDLYNPPAEQVHLASTLSQKPRVSSAALGTPITLLRLEQRKGSSHSGYYDQVWRDAGDISKLDPAGTYYYMPLSGFAAESKYSLSKGQKVRYVNMTELHSMLTNAAVPGTTAFTIYGVRKTDINAVRARANWVNLEDHIARSLMALDDKYWMQVLRDELNAYSFLSYHPAIKPLVDASSQFLKTYAHFEGVTKLPVSTAYLTALLQTYAPTVKDPLQQMRTKFKAECAAIYARYPLIKFIDASTVNAQLLKDIAAYINMCDATAA